jgi:hypothetical protein
VVSNSSTWNIFYFQATDCIFTYRSLTIFYIFLVVEKRHCPQYKDETNSSHGKKKTTSSITTSKVLQGL